MYYQQPPPPQYPPPQYGPRYSGCLKFFLYLLSLFVPFVGIVIAIVFMSRGDPESKGVGQVCLIISIIVIIIGCCVGVIFGVAPVIIAAIEGGSYY